MLGRMRRTIRLSYALCALAIAGEACGRGSPPSAPEALAPLPPSVPPASGLALPLPTPASPVSASGAAELLGPGHVGAAGHGLPAPATVEIGAFAPLERTLAAALAERKSLSGQEIEVRGRVVRVRERILDRTWLHLREPGSDADLTVTSSQTVRPGDLVRAKGRLAVDKDVGAALHYDALLEDAVLVVEAPAAATGSTP
jgi:hypothetical protein